MAALLDAVAAVRGLPGDARGDAQRREKLVMSVLEGCLPCLLVDDVAED